LRDLERAIAQLPEEQRSVILLVGLEGMRYEEVAAVLDVPVGTISSRLLTQIYLLYCQQSLLCGGCRMRSSITVRTTDLLA
jgi:DNA-directed RNA polymerase specialized sigma subunit